MTHPELRSVEGLFYRIVPAMRAEQVLAPAISPEGRFHHDSQPTLYVSSRPDWAEHAIRAYVRAGDAPRVICEIALGEIAVLDLRDRAQCAAWGADPALAAIPWLPERAAGRPASSWRLSDLARAHGAQGLIYTARSAPARWHLMLFDWHAAKVTGRQLPYPLEPASTG